ncbi:hypothetical protein CH274_13510 [Rhodococcus sp. 06-418-5]|uniref:hypothetical protein n=1 Tax=Rhodococcus sp. 06-418-5 TaxID=2022507 RepID=UPI000B9C2BBD|nr:hypothetical protein [Rhodococcus sp. 06-418-5]OZC80247.1 hypothetical protein CH274_13510 [Rhodococcus sp. 06-418-5]
MNGWCLFGIVSAIVMALGVAWSVFMIATQTGDLLLASAANLPVCILLFCSSAYIAISEWPEK